MKWVTGLLVLPFLMGLATPSSAQQADAFLDAFQVRTAEDLRRLCTRQPSEPFYAEARSFCLGFIEGGAQLHNLITEVEGINRMVCGTNRATRDEAVDVFLAFAAAHPEAMTRNAMDVLVEAAANKWPCESPREG